MHPQAKLNTLFQYSDINALLFTEQALPMHMTVLETVLRQPMQTVPAVPIPMTEAAT